MKGPAPTTDADVDGLFAGARRVRSFVVVLGEGSVTAGQAYFTLAHRLYRVRL